MPPYDEFLVGGADLFAGLSPGELRGPYFAVASLGYRHRFGRLPPGLGEGIYLSLRGDAGNAWADSDDIDAGNLRYGGLGAVGLDTIAGPLYLGFGQADRGSSRFFLSLGSDF